MGECLSVANIYECLMPALWPMTITRIFIKFSRRVDRISHVLSVNHLHAYRPRRTVLSRLIALGSREIAPHTGWRAETRTRRSAATRTAEKIKINPRVSSSPDLILNHNLPRRWKKVIILLLYTNQVSFELQKCSEYVSTDCTSENEETTAFMDEKCCTVSPKRRN